MYHANRCCLRRWLPNHDMPKPFEEDDLRRRFQEKFDERYVGCEEFKDFKDFRYGRVEKIVFGVCALVLAGVVTAVLAFVINKPI